MINLSTKYMCSCIAAQPNKLSGLETSFSENRKIIQSRLEMNRMMRGKLNELVRVQPCAGGSIPSCPRRFLASAPQKSSRWGGKNVFEAAAAALDAQTSSSSSSSVKAIVPPLEPIPLPTSDESEVLLRIRHSVSVMRPKMEAHPIHDHSSSHSVHTSWPWQCRGHTRMH